MRRRGRRFGGLIGVWAATLAVTLAMTLGAAVVSAAFDAARAQPAAAPPCQLDSGPRRAVAKVIDGETVRLDDGKVVRLLGVRVPHAGDAGAVAGTWPPETAAAAALARLVTGQSVTLAFAGPRTDRYGRVLAHLFVERDGQRMWVQDRLAGEGHARVFAPPGSEACTAMLLAQEARARTAAKGLWSHAAYDVRPAERPGEIARFAGTFQIVEGRVARITGARTLVIVTFESLEPGGRKDSASRPLRVVWQRPVRALVDGEPARRLTGRRLRVRGWIEMRSGPQIEVVAAHQIEVLHDPPASAPTTAEDLLPVLVPKPE